MNKKGHHELGFSVYSFILSLIGVIAVFVVGLKDKLFRFFR
jgi:hypothetical protein